MLTGPDQKEQFQTIQRINLAEKGPFHLESRIELPGGQLGVNSWPEMIEQTQAEDRERGVVVSSFFGKFRTSPIFKGDEPSITSPVLPHGVSSLWPFAKYITHVHSHPMPEALSHLQTTIVSDTDIRNFRNSSVKAMIIIDRGGAHLLLHDYFADFEKELPQFNLSHSALNKIKDKGNTVMDAMKELARILNPYGIRYYYSPTLEPKNEHLQFTDVITLPQTP